MNYRINTPRIVHEMLDDETIIIDFETGTYYSLRDTANQIWLLLGEGYATPAIVNHIMAQYSGEQEEIEAAIRQFIGQLAQGEVVVATAEAQTLPPLAPMASKSVAFVPPVLEEYTDIQDLLLLDPIHEVDKSGWPAAKV
ncbi:MAG: PqqD family protein [Caldilineaceae bacterium]|nr:PqqD family protein [Caldilineaceae bacterium]